MKLKITFSIVFLFIISFIYGQSFIEKQLPPPNELTPFFIGPLFNSTIHYGAVPPNYNGEVIIFNHGYSDMNQVYFFLENTFYEDAYNAGYQVAFVATTRGEGMWENGRLLANSIDIVTAKYDVDDLYVIAHSNGGRASEVALFHHNKKNKVKKVFALGTPFWGTYLADLSQMWWFNWLWKHTGLNEGAATSTTYYCTNLVRPYFDNHYRNQPEKFVTFGAHGFNSVNSIFSVPMIFSGSILYNYQGSNDGVTPYSSSKRPGSVIEFSQNDSRGFINHIDIALGQYVWEHIEPYLDGNNYYNKNESDRFKNNLKVVEYEVVSDYQIINSENDYDFFMIKNKDVFIELIHENKRADFKITGIDKLQSKKINKRDKNSTIIELSGNTTKPISIKSNSKFIGFVRQKDEPTLMKYKITNDYKPLLQVAFENESNINKINVNAIITKTAEIDGTPIKNQISEPYNFKLINGKFELKTENFDDGIYSVYVTGNASSFTRTLFAGFSIGKLKSINSNYTEPLVSKTNSNFVKLKNTLVGNELKLEFNKISNENANINGYNLNGKKVFSLSKTITHKNVSITTKVSSLAKGIYLITVELNGENRTFKFLKK